MASAFGRLARSCQVGQTLTSRARHKAREATTLSGALLQGRVNTTPMTLQATGPTPGRASLGLTALQREVERVLVCLNYART